VFIVFVVKFILIALTLINVLFIKLIHLFCFSGKWDSSLNRKVQIGTHPSKSFVIVWIDSTQSHFVNTTIL
jgi:hypothetical protein